MNYEKLSIADLTGLWLMYEANYADAMQNEKFRSARRYAELQHPIEAELKKRGVEL